MSEHQKSLAIVGSTGSIGTQTLDIVASHSDRYVVAVLVAGSNVEKLIAQALQFKPSIAVIADESKYQTLSEALRPHGIETAAGADAICDAVCRDDVDMVVTATVGYSGLAPTIAAIKADKDIALANKETLVVAGAYVNDLLKKSKSKIYPVDSEHSAIYQCLKGESVDSVNSLIITASGGPFRTWTVGQIEKATAADALRHPNWSMGAKITIDSATMMNKAFEIIEAHWLFDIPGERIRAVVHPQSIVHSMVEFVDGAVKAQLGVPDMRLPIAYALGYATRLPGVERHLSLADYSTLTFEAPDTNRFPCLTLATTALSRGGNTACIVNAANEIAVAQFLAGEIAFNDIYRLIAESLEHIDFVDNPSYEDYVRTNLETRKYASTLAKRINH